MPKTFRLVDGRNAALTAGRPPRSTGTYHESMARLRIADGSLEVQLSPLERFGAFHGNITVPLSAVQSMQIVDHPFQQLRGIRAPGTGFPGVIALGTWRYSGGKDFVAVYDGQRGVVIDLDGTEFRRLVIGTPDPEAVLGRLGRSGLR